jgi:hypothetical protein
VGPRARLDVVAQRKIMPCQELNHSHPECSLVTALTELSWLLQIFGGVHIMKIALSGLVVACLPLDPRFAGSNPAGDNGLLRVIKIRSTTSF